VSDRHLPVRPNLDQLKHQAKDLLREMKHGNRAAKLAEAQLALARGYGIVSWPRLVLACRLIEAIWKDDAAMVRTIVRKHPALLHEMARGTQGCNWGPPMSYAANLGRDRIIDALREMGASDLGSAFDRATLRGQIDTARKLYDMAGRPPLPRDAAMGPAETLHAEGMALVLELGGTISDASGDWRAPVAMTLETYSRCRFHRSKAPHQ